MHIEQAVVRRVVVRKVYYLSRLFSVMPFLKEIRDLLLLSHSANFISEEEFLVLYEEYQPANLTFPHSSYGELTSITWKTMNVWRSFGLKSKI